MLFSPQMPLPLEPPRPDRLEDFVAGPNEGALAAVQALLALCTGFLDWFDPNGRLPVQEVARLYAQFALRGIQNPAVGRGEN